MAYTSALVSLAMLFLLMGVGLLVGKKGWISQNGADEMTKILMQITLPCTIFNSMLREYDSALLSDALLTMGLAAAVICLSIGVAALLCRLLRIKQGSRGMWILLATFSNTGFMGFPVVNALYGAEGLLLAASFNLPFNIIIFTAGSKLVCSDNHTSASFSLKKILFTNINIALVLGLIFFVSQIPVPGPVKTFISYLGDMTTPLSMIVVGVSMSQEKASSLFKAKNALTASLARLLVMPLLLLAVLRLIPYFDHSLMASVMVVITAMPSAVAGVLLGRQYGGNVRLASSGVFVSSILCIATLPLILLLL